MHPCAQGRPKQGEQSRLHCNRKGGRFSMWGFIQRYGYVSYKKSLLIGCILSVKEQGHHLRVRLGRR